SDRSPLVPPPAWDPGRRRADRPSFVFLPKSSGVLVDVAGLAHRQPSWLRLPHGPFELCHLLPALPADKVARRTPSADRIRCAPARGGARAQYATLPSSSHESFR